MLLSGLIGVVSWKRPLSLVVSVLRTPVALNRASSLAMLLHAASITRITVND